MQLSQKQNTFSEFVAAFSKTRLNFEHFQKKITLIVDIFPKLRTPRNVAKKISKKSPFRGPFENQHGKGTKTVKI